MDITAQNTRSTDQRIIDCLVICPAGDSNFLCGIYGIKHARKAHLEAAIDRLRSSQKGKSKLALLESRLRDYQKHPWHEPSA